MYGVIQIGKFDSKLPWGIFQLKPPELLSMQHFSLRKGLNFEACVWRAVSSHHPQEAPLAQFSLYVHKSGLKPDLFLFLRKDTFAKIEYLMDSCSNHCYWE